MDANTNTNSGDGLQWVPGDTCTLPTVEQPLRVAEFDALFADHLAVVERLDAGRVSVRLEGGDEVRRIAQDLAERETSCCSFFAFDVQTVDSGGVRIVITVPREREAVLDALAARAARAGRHGHH